MLSIVSLDLKKDIYFGLKFHPRSHPVLDGPNFPKYQTGKSGSSVDLKKSNWWFEFFGIIVIVSITLSLSKHF